MTESVQWLTTTIASAALVFLTAALVYFTRMLWKSTRRLADATDAMAAATAKGSELAHGSRLTANWDVVKTKAGMVRVCIKDRRSVPVLIDAVYSGTSQDLTTKKTRNGEWPVIRLHRAQRWLYTVGRSADQPFHIDVPINIEKVADRSLSIIVQVEVHYRDFGSDRQRLFSTSCFCEVRDKYPHIAVTRFDESHNRFDSSHWEEDGDEFPPEKKGDFVGKSTDPVLPH